ncbi:hypothetical protein Tco_0488451 [Tanacetum coccineum]
MAIPDTLISEEIRTAAYYSEYVAKVTKYQWYLAEEAVIGKPAASKTSKSSASQPSKPTLAPAKPQQKKRKLVEDTTKAPSQAKHLKAGKVLKKRTLSSTPQLVDEFVDEGVPNKEPMHVFREPDTGKIQPLLEVEGKGKEKVGEEQAAQVLLNLQTPNKKNPVEQFIFQRCTPATTEPSGLVESSSLYAELGLTDSETDSDEEVSPDMNAQGQEVGQGGTNPGDAGMSQTPSRLSKVQENLKLPTKGDVRLKEPASSAGTLSSMKNLNKEFLVEKSQEDELEKTNTEVEDITDLKSDSTTGFPLYAYNTTTTVTETTTTTTVPPPPPQLQQDISTSILTQTIGQLEQNIADLRADSGIYRLAGDLNRKIKESLKEVVSRISSAAIRGPLFVLASRSPTSDMKGRFCIKTHVRENYERDKRNQQERLLKHYRNLSLVMKPPLPPPPPPPSGASGAFGPKGTSDFAQDPPPSPPSSTTNRGDQSYSSATSGSSKIAASTTYIAWTTTTSRLEPAASSIPKDVLMHEQSDFEAQDMGSDDEDSGSRHIPKVSLNQEWFKPLSEEERPATPEPAWSIPSSSLQPVPNNNWASAIASSFVSPPRTLCFHIPVILECLWIGSARSKESQSSHRNIWKVLHMKWSKPSILTYNVSRPLLLGGPPGQVTIQTEFFFNKDLEYLRFGHKDVAEMKSICRTLTNHWTHMRILSVVRIEVFSLYGYDYMKKIVLRRADNQEYTIAESDFKDLYPSDFEDLYLLNLQGHLNHLPPKDKKILSTAVNLWIRNLEATGLEFMHNYKILDSPRAVVFKDKYGMQMIMRFNEIHKFSDGTLHQIDEALDYRVKEFKVNKVNTGLNTRQVCNDPVIPTQPSLATVQDPSKDLFHSSWRSMHFYLLSRSELDDIEKVGPHGSGGSSKDGDGDTSFQ